MFFSRRTAASVPLTRSEQLRERLLPHCYDEFSGTKIHNIIEHPKPEGDRIFLRVQYSGSAAVKAMGARWDPDVRRWWYWSGSTDQLEHYHDPEVWLETLKYIHRKSLFAGYTIDVDFMRHTKCEAFSLDDFFDYRNPASDARAK